MLAGGQHVAAGINAKSKCREQRNQSRKRNLLPDVVMKAQGSNKGELIVVAEDVSDASEDYSL